MIVSFKHTHGLFRCFYKRLPMSSAFPTAFACGRRCLNSCSAHHRLTCPRGRVLPHWSMRFTRGGGTWWCTRSSHIINSLGFCCIRKIFCVSDTKQQKFTYATSTQVPPAAAVGNQKEETERTPMKIVMQQIRSQELSFKRKLERDAVQMGEIERRLIGEVGSRHLHGQSNELKQPTDSSQKNKNPEKNPTTTLPIPVKESTAKELQKTKLTKELIFAKTATEPSIKHRQTNLLLEDDALPPVTPKFKESSTHRVKLLLDNPVKPSDVIASEMYSLKYKVDVKNRIFLAATPEKGEKPSAQIEPIPREIHDGPVDTLGTTQKQKQLITSIINKQMANVVANNEKGAGGIKDGGDGTNNKNKNTNRWRRLKYVMGLLGLASTCVGSYMLIQMGRPKYDIYGNMILDRYSHMPIIMQYLYRIKDELETYNKMIKEPSREKLLPDVLQPPYYQPPYTLVLEFTDLLVHPEWTYQTGWRFKKRPGVDQFLEALCTRFEVVVYTAQLGMTVFPILEMLDTKNLISYKLVRDATNFVDGHHVKDLDKINRDLSKVVVVDWNPHSVKLHKCNLFKIPRWEGNDDDRTLYDLAAFLIAISEWEVQDVRAVLEYYGQFDNPLMKFKENQMHVLTATQ